MRIKIKTAAFVLASAVFTASFAFLASAAVTQTVLLGDADRNGTIEAADARFALRCAVGLEYYDAADMLICDVDDNGYIQAEDARSILRSAVGLDSFEGKTVSVRNSSAVLDELLSAPPVAAPVVNAPSGTFTFVSYGRGHEVGLTQWGAVVLADAGLTYDEILAYYFTGTYLDYDTSYHETTVYNGVSVNTGELVARIVAMEISGVTSNPEALKAQAVAIYTLIKYYNYNATTNSIGVAVSSYSDSRCSQTVKDAAKAVLGQFVAGADGKPVLTIYSASCGGRTLSPSEKTWKGAAYPSSVRSPFDCADPYYITIYTYSVEQMRTRIQNYASRKGIRISLQSDPADWIEILKHDASIDADRGHPYEVRVGDKVLYGIGEFSTYIVGMNSDCFTVTYTP